MAVVIIMEENETMEFTPSVEDTPSEETPTEETPVEGEESTDETPVEESTEEEAELFELPDGRKVDAATLQTEWKENFAPEFTRRSQELAEKRNQAGTC